MPPQCEQDVLVVTEGARAAAARRPAPLLQQPAEIRANLQPKVLNDAQQFGGARGSINAEVKLLVRLGFCGEVTRRNRPFHREVALLERTKFLRRHPGRRPPRGEPLDREANLRKILELK